MLLSFLSQTEHWIAAGILFFFFALFAVGNGIYLIDKIASNFENGPSFGPLFGGFFGVLAVLLLPVGEVSDRLPWVWVPLLLDAGCLPMFVIIPLYVRFMDKRRPR